jgi:Xaa-Pro aminopeptidase
MTNRERDLRAVCQAGHQVFSRLKVQRLSGLTEVQVAQRIKRLYRELGITQLAFPTIVAAGKHAAEPHHVPNHQRRLKTGDAVVLDFGGRVNGWCGDMSRTVFVGSPNAWQREMYGRIVEAQRVSISTIRPGQLAMQVDAVARVSLAPGHLTPHFIHSLGHGVGQKVHEAPWISPSKGTQILKVGDCVAIEPGLYFKGRAGFRVEDMVWVGQQRGELLVASERGWRGMVVG